MKFHAVMLDETMCEFGVEVEAENKDAAWEILIEDYPESRCIQLESESDTAKRERAMYDHISRGGDYDDEGRPIEGPGYDYGPEDE